MTHLPRLHGMRGSFCSADVESTPGISPFPAPLPIRAGEDLCPECRSAHDDYTAAWIRAAIRYPHLDPARLAKSG